MAARPIGLASMVVLIGLCLEGLLVLPEYALAARPRTLLQDAGPKQVLPLHKFLPQQSVTAQTLHSGATSTRQTTREGKVQELTGDGQNGKIINNYLLGSDDSIMAGLSVNNNNEALQHAGQQIRVSLLPLSKNDSKSSDGNNNAVLEDATADDSKQVSSKTYGSQMPYTAVARKLAQVSTTANNPKQDASSKDVSVTDRQPVTNLTSVIFLLNYCGLKNLYNASTFRKIWLNDPGTPANAFTMQNYVSYCSQGMAQMPSASQLIFNVELPCNGVWYHPFMRNRPFDLSKNCGTTEKLYMFNKATEIVENASRISISSIRQRIAILPQNNPCSSTWGGSSYISCTNSSSHCDAMIASPDMRSIMHDMGHNLGVMHAGRSESDDEQADTTCIMGRGQTCFNAPNAWRLGWLDPLPGGDLNGTTLAVGQPRTFTVPVQTKARQSFVRIYPDWKILGNEPKSTYYPSFPVPAIYISFRSKYEPFENLTTEDDNSVNIYTYKGDRSLVDSFWRTQHVKALKAGGLTEYRDDGWSGVVVRLVRVMPGDSAVVVVCRSSGPTESQGGNTCSDGLDNDCDGLVDAEQDGDCNGVRTSPSPPPFPPSPPPRPPPSPSPPPQPPRPPPNPPYRTPPRPPPPVLPPAKPMWPRRPRKPPPPSLEARRFRPPPLSTASSQQLPPAPPSPFPRPPSPLPPWPHPPPRPPRPPPRPELLKLVRMPRPPAAKKRS